MKLSIKKKKKQRSRESEEDSSRMGGSAWMIKGREKLKQEAKRSEAMAKSNRRPPELWIPDGDSRVIRFRHDEPIGIYQYSVKINGKWHSVTMPPAGAPDLFKRANMTPQLRYVYEVIDVKGYTDKKTGKRLKNLPRFYKANGRVEKTLEKFREKFGGLTKRNFEISRTGTSTDTTYTVIPEDREPMTPEMLKAENLTKQFEDYYRPPTKEEQKVMLAGLSTDDEDDD